MWELDCEESWEPKTWCFWTVVLEKTLESPLDCKEIQPVHSEGDQPWDSLKGMLKLKLQYFGHLMRRVDSWKRPWCWEGLGARGEGDDRGWDGWMASPTQWTWLWVNSGSWWWTGRPGMLQFMGSQSRTRLSNWTELNWSCLLMRNFLLASSTSLPCHVCICVALESSWARRPHREVGGGGGVQWEGSWLLSLKSLSGKVRQGKPCPSARVCERERDKETDVILICGL